MTSAQVSETGELLQYTDECLFFCNKNSDFALNFLQEKKKNV